MQSDWRSSLSRTVATHRREALLVAAGVALAYWAMRLSLPHLLGAFGDDAVYVALGKAIASGQGYRSIYAAGQPVQLKYPPGLPLVLAVLWLLGRSLATVTWLAETLSVLVSAAAAGLVWWIARAKLGLNPLVAFVCAIGPFLMDAAILYFNLPISEPYFMLAWAVALVVAYRLRERSSVTWAVVLGLTVAAATLFRTEGVALIAGFALALALQRIPWRTLATYLAAALTPVVAWVWLHASLVANGPVSTQPDELPYTAWLPVHSLADPFRLAVAAVRVTWPWYWRWFATYVSEVRLVGFVILSIWLALVVAGVVLVARRHQALWCTTLGSAVLVLLWPWPQDRFVFSFLPFAGLLAGVAVQTAVHRAGVRVRRLAYAGLVLIAVGIAARQVTLRRLVYRPVSAEAVLGVPYVGQFLAGNASYISIVSRWLRDHTAPTDRILVDQPAAIYLYTGRQTVAATPVESAIAPSLFAHPGAYLARRILDDSVTVVVLSVQKQRLTGDVNEMYRRCSGVLQYAGNARFWSGGPIGAYFFQVTHRDACVEQLAQRGREPGSGDGPR